ncbi:unnamed protein product, partial [Ceratitis capitata]
LLFNQHLKFWTLNNSTLIAHAQVWSVTSAEGMGPLYIVEGTMRRDQYKRVLETRLLPQIKE